MSPLYFDRAPFLLVYSQIKLLKMNDKVKRKRELKRENHLVKFEQKENVNVWTKGRDEKEQKVANFITNIYKFIRERMYRGHSTKQKDTRTQPSSLPLCNRFCIPKCHVYFLIFIFNLFTSCLATPIVPYH